MTIDDENSVYVGGLPYSATEDTLRRNFDLYGAVVGVKIIKDHTTKGKCYGFVTFSNPRSAIDAINDMDGRNIDGRAVRVNEVTSRGGKSNSSQLQARHSDWDRRRDRERNHDHHRDRHQDQYSDRSRVRDRSRDHYISKEREYRHSRDKVDRVMDHLIDRDLHQDRDSNARERSRERKPNEGRDKEPDESNDYRSADENKDQHSRGQNGALAKDRFIRELFSDSSEDYSDQVKEQLDASIHRHDELHREILRMERDLEEKQQHVFDLQRSSKKLEDELITAKKLSSQRKLELKKLHKCFLQVRDYTEKLKSCEQELQSLVDSATKEGDVGDDFGTRHEALSNGKAY